MQLQGTKAGQVQEFNSKCGISGAGDKLQQSEQMPNIHLWLNLDHT